MSLVGTQQSLWRYPVKSMRGEQLAQAFVGYAGIYGDRIFAISSSECPAVFPYITGREQAQMLLYQPRFRQSDKAARPPTLEEAESIGSGLTPVFADPTEMLVDVETPAGQKLAIDDPLLMEQIGSILGRDHSLSVMRSDRAMTDCRPISLISNQTTDLLAEELEMKLDKRRFRANIYFDAEVAEGFIENALVGKTVKIGQRAVLAIVERDARCKMITLDPDSAESNPDVLRTVVRKHNGTAGVYAVVLVEGMVRAGDGIELVE
jgi:uncharacterized protein YcbX